MFCLNLGERMAGSEITPDLFCFVSFFFFFAIKKS